MHAWTKRRYKEWLHRQRPLAMRTDEISDEEVVRAIKSVPVHRTNPSFVQSWTQSQAGSGTTVTTPAAGANVVVGDSIFVGIVYYTKTTNVSSVTDSLGNSYSAITLVHTNAAATLSGVFALWGCLSATHGGASDTITVNWDAATSGYCVGAAEFSGLTATQEAAGVVLNYSTGTPNAVCGSCTTTNANDLILIGFCAGAGSGLFTTTEPAGYTIIAEELDAGSFLLGGFDYAIVSVTQSGITPTWGPFKVSGVNTNIDAGTLIVAYKGVVAGSFNPGWAYGATRSPGGIF